MTNQLQPNNELDQSINDNFGLIVSNALYFKLKDKSLLEDCIQVGVIAFSRAYSKYDKNKAKFSTYMSSCIRNAIYDFLEKENRLQMSNNLQDEGYLPSEEFWELIPDDLLSIEKTIIMLKLEGYTKHEIADVTNLTNKEVIKIFNSAKQKIVKANE